MRKLLAALALSAGLVTPACLGPNHAFEGIRNWNAELSEQDWINEVVFLGLTIVPVYSFAYLGDILLFNTIDYWSGGNPIGEPGTYPEGFGRDK